MKNKNQSLSQARPFRKRLRSLLAGKALLLAFLLCQSNYLKAQNPSWVFKSTDGNTYKIIFNHRGQAYLSKALIGVEPDVSYIYGSYPDRSFITNPSISAYTKPLEYLGLQYATSSIAAVRPYFNNNTMNAMSILEKFQAGWDPNTPWGIDRLVDNDFETIIVPGRQNCNQYLALATNKMASNTSFPGASQLYIHQQTWTGSGLSTQGSEYLRVLENGVATNLDHIPSAHVKIAFSNKNAGGHQFLYVAVGKDPNFIGMEGIYRFTYTDVGQAFWENKFIAGSPGSNSPTQTFAAARIIGPAQAPGATFITSELEVSPDGTQIAWADNNSATGGSNRATVYVASLSNFGQLSGSVTQMPLIPSGTDVTNSQINGLEFNPNTTSTSRLYVTAGVDKNTSTDGIFKIDYSGGVYTPSRLEFEYADRFAQTHLEANVNGFINLFGMDLGGRYKLMQLNPATNSMNAAVDLQPVILPGPTSATTIRKLPRQIDGFHYEYNDIYGPAFVKTISNICSNPDPDYPSVNQTVRYWVKDKPYTAYSWSITGPAPLPVLTQIAPNIYDITFPATSGEYVVNVTYTTPGSVQCITTSRLTVKTGDGCLMEGSRIANSANHIPETGVYPNPAQDKVTVKLLPGEEQASVTITDSKGSFIKKVDVAHTADKIDVNNLPNGLYFISVSTATSNRVNKLLISR